MKDSFRKLKIAIVMDRFVPSRGGESYFSWLAQELSDRGHEVHVFAWSAKEVDSAGVQIHLVPVWGHPRSLRLLSFLINSGRFVKRYDFDIIHGVGWSLAMNVFNPHGGVEQALLKRDFLSMTNRFYYVHKFLKRYLFPQHYLKVWIQKRQYLSGRVKKIIAISQMVKRDIIRYHGLPEEKIAIVFNSVDLDRFHPKNREMYREQRRKALGIDPRTLLLIFAGNNYRLKGLEPLLHALVLLRQQFANQPFRLLIAGRGRVGHYRRKAKRWGVSDLTLFLGPVREMEQYYGASDIYVHPTFYDSCSLTVLEALASGLPAITTRFNGAAEVIVSDQGGKVLEDPADIGRLADSISYYFDEGRRNEARIVARQWMERYPPQRNLEETLRVYDEVAAGRD
jgi:UDP-glucose:(heptosyl)LPS alpha-1,3-glucosyltransferase